MQIIVSESWHVPPAELTSKHIRLKKEKRPSTLQREAEFQLHSDILQTQLSYSRPTSPLNMNSREQALILVVLIS